MSLGNLRENGDELRRQQLRPQRSDLSNVAQQSQHVAVKLLLVWKLLRGRSCEGLMEQQKMEEKGKFTCEVHH